MEYIFPKGTPALIYKGSIKPSTERLPELEVTFINITKELRLYEDYAKMISDSLKRQIVHLSNVCGINTNNYTIMLGAKSAKESDEEYEFWYIFISSDYMEAKV